jgi:hypothetical protein
MNQKSLANWIKAIVIGVGLGGIMVYFWLDMILDPTVISDIAGYEVSTLPWNILILITLIPCYGVLVFVWKIAHQVELDNSFSFQNVGYLKWIMLLCLSIAVIFFCGNIILLIMNINHPSIFILSIFFCFVAIAIGIIAAVLAHLVEKAAIIKEENDAFV